MPRTIMMFCGQGAQYYQMGRELHQQNSVFRGAMDRCDAAAGLVGGRRISEIIFSRPLADSEHFDLVTETNPALLAIGYSLSVTLLESRIVPERLLGYSLGETIAAVVAGVLSLQEGFRLVQAQARLFEQLAPEGTMLAILTDPARVTGMSEVMGFCDMAAINAPRHCVVSLLTRDLPAVTGALDRARLTWVRLPIRYPFHSAAIDALAEPMRQLFATFRFAPPRWPIVSATLGAVVQRFDGEHMWRVMRGMLHFRQTVESLSQEGPWTMVEAGPSGTLTSFTRQVRAPGLTAWPAIDQFGQNMKTIRQLVAAAT